MDAAGRAIQQFAYKTGGSGVRRANGAGSTLEIVSTTASPADPANWRHSAALGGSPAAASPPTVSVAIHEILANTAEPDSDRIELLNYGALDVDISHWYITDDAHNYFKGAIAPSKTVPASGYLVLSQSELAFDLDGINGGELLLISADANGRPLQFVDQVQFGLADRGISLGPWPTRADPFIPLDEATLGSPNAGPQVGDVIISEVYFAPLDPDEEGFIQAGDLEFLELTNVTDQPVPLTGWRLTGDVQYALPDGVTLAAGDSLVIAGFDPATVAGRGKASVFKFALGMDFADALYGRMVDPALGTRTRDALKNEGASVQLVRPGLPAADDPAAIPMVIVDQVAYRPEVAVAPGDCRRRSIAGRTRPQEYGPRAASWVAAEPSPGWTAFFERLAGDANSDGQFDALDLSTAGDAAKYLTGQLAGWSDGDWTGDGVFSQLDIVAALQTGRFAP